MTISSIKSFNMTKKIQLIVHNLERAVKVLLGDDSIKDRLYEAYSAYIAELDLSILDEWVMNGLFLYITESYISFVELLPITI